MNSELLKHVQHQLKDDYPVDCDTWWRLFQVNEQTGIVKKLIAQRNIIPFQGADILAQVLIGNVSFKAAAMFFEYENNAVPASIAIPEAARDEDISYYLNDIPLTPNRDYLRIPLVVPAGISASDANYNGNQATFFAMTTGSEGIHGVPFGSATDSHVFGVGLAATPNPTESTQDRLFSRSYDGFDPVPKEDGFQIGAQYMIRFR